MARKYANQIKEIEIENVEKVNAMKEAVHVEIVEINDKNRALKEELTNRSKCTEASMEQVQGELLKKDETIDELVIDNHEKKIQLEKLAAEEREAVRVIQFTEIKMKDMKGALLKAEGELEVKAQELKHFEAAAAKMLNQYQSTTEKLEKKLREEINNYKFKIEQSVDKYESKLDEFEQKMLEDGNIIKDCLEKMKDQDEKCNETLQKTNMYKLKIEESTKQLNTKIKEQKVEALRSNEEYQARILALEKVHAESTWEAMALVVAGAALIAVVAWK